MDESLKGRAWLLGNDITGADIMMSYPLQAAAERFGLDAYPNIRAYLARIEADPAYIRAVKKAGTSQLG